MLSHLKVKVFSLSSEMTYIRRQEEKWKSRARRARKWQATLALEATKAQALSKQQYAESNFWSQHWHRHELKDHARLTHLAYGCMRNVPYSKMEVICYGPLKGFGGSEPQWAKIESIVERFSKDEPDPQGYMQRFAEWLADAKKWYEGNPERIIQMNNARLAERAAKTAVKTITATL